MKAKILNALIIFASLLGYLEWGGNNTSFLAEAEFTILKGLFTDPKNMVHPFILIPLSGQLLLVYSLFQKNPGKVLSVIGICSIALLLGFMFFIGMLGLNFKIIFSTLPFLILSFLRITQIRTTK